MIESLREDPDVRAALDEMRPHEQHEEALERVAWSVLAEPGDGVAGALIAELGAHEALEVALAGRSRAQSGGGRTGTG